MGPVEEVSTEARQVVSLQKPAMDLQPVELFKKEHDNKHPSAFGIPVHSYRQSGGAVVTGVQFHAKAWNPPVGWFRVPWL